MRYTILTAETPEELEAKVNEHLADGWTPCGGVDIRAYMAEWERLGKGYTESEERREYAQAMTRVTP